jgi:hypothetical protein
MTGANTMTSPKPPDDPVAPEHPTLVGPDEIAAKLDARKQTVQQWISRGVIPKPRFWISGPVWDWEEDIYPWARATRRLPLFDMTPDTYHAFVTALERPRRKLKKP